MERRLQMVTNKMRRICGFVCLIILALCANVLSGQVETTPRPSKAYSNKRLGLSFVVPKGVNLYTAEHPGPLRFLISEQEPLILVNPDFTEESINLQVIGNISESDVVGYEELLQEGQTLPVPEYKRESVAMIRIGKDNKKLAVEHIYFMKGNIKGKLRSITFAHKEKGFTFTCATSPERFDSANKAFFQALFDTMTFE
jgi:hypothetical protein